MPEPFRPLPDDPRFVDPQYEDRAFPTASYEVRVGLRNARPHFRALLDSPLGRMEPRGKAASAKRGQKAGTAQ